MRFLLLLLLPTIAPACDRPVCMIDPDSVHHTRNITFDDQTSGYGPGRPQTGTMALPGASFGEILQGKPLNLKVILTGSPAQPRHLFLCSPARVRT